jgi:glucose-6-phosphate 1-epimerase
MPTDDLRRFEIPKVASFEPGQGGLTSLAILSKLGKARIYLQGAHVTDWTPAGEQPVLFMSKRSHFAPGKPIRGGVPVCFPWFAARTGHPESPAHGFVRNADWDVESVTQLDDDSVVASFTIGDSEATRAHWPHAFLLRHRVTIGKTLEMTLEVENRGDKEFTFEEALHTYFDVSAVQAVEITGLEGAEYIDKVAAQARKRHPREKLRFTEETDRVFPGTTSKCVLTDPGFRREIVVKKSGSDTTVVWNPWIAKAAAMPDFGDDEWPYMACIETANSGENAVTLAPGKSHSMTAEISVQSM